MLHRAIAAGLIATLACGGSPSGLNGAPVPTASVAPVPTPKQPAPTQPSSPPSSSSGGTVMIGGAQSCNKDTDCEVVELACCDHCNGGRVDAFNQLVADQQRPTCGATSCTRRACSPHLRLARAADASSSQSERPLFPRPEQ